MFQNMVLRRIFGHTRGEVTGEWRRLYNEELRSVAIKKPDSCSNPLLKKSENRNVIPFNVVPSPIPTPLHANFPLLEAVLQVILC